MLPGLKRLAYLGNAGNPTTAPEMLEVQSAARTLRIPDASLAIKVSEAGVHDAREIEHAITAFASDPEGD